MNIYRRNTTTFNNRFWKWRAEVNNSLAAAGFHVERDDRIYGLDSRRGEGDAPRGVLGFAYIELPHSLAA